MTFRQNKVNQFETDHIFVFHIEKKSKPFNRLCRYLITGIWTTQASF